MQSPNGAEGLFFKSLRHPFEGRDEPFTQLSAAEIAKATTFLAEYLGANTFTTEASRIYDISLGNGYTMKVASSLTKLFCHGSECMVEVSNPQTFYSARFWISFKHVGAYWSSPELINSLQPPWEVLFEFLSKNVVALWKRELRGRAGLLEPNSYEARVFGSNPDLGDDDISIGTLSSPNDISNEELIGIERRQEMFMLSVLRKLLPQ